MKFCNYAMPHVFWLSTNCNYTLPWYFYRALGEGRLSVYRLGCAGWKNTLELGGSLLVPNTIQRILEIVFPIIISIIIFFLKRDLMLRNVKYRWYWSKWPTHFHRLFNKHRCNFWYILIDLCMDSLCLLTGANLVSTNFSWRICYIVLLLQYVSVVQILESFLFRQRVTWQFFAKSSLPTKKLVHSRSF